jgi:hypothetical protein
MNNTTANDPAAKGAGAAPENPNAASGTSAMGTGSAATGASGTQTAANTNTDAASDSTLQDRIVLSASREDLEKAPKLDDSAAKPAQ